MSFLYPQAVLPVAVVAILLILVIIVYEKKYFSWVNLYWFYSRTWSNKLSTLFFFLAIICLLVAMLDLRGPEERISTNIPDQKTIILIDASSSMLVEDVRPNRFERALFLARHFIRNAIGHQIAVVLFSDTSKRLISFTDDLDLLDARISGLEEADLSSAGSNITISLKESVNYFKEQTKKDEKLSGNILLFTDGEETAEGVEKTLPPEIALAVVGVGTSKGGPIPIRSEHGSFRGYKEYKGERVVSKLDEQWLKAFGQSHDLYKYWVALSYNVPTDQVLGFFESVFNDRLSQGEMRYRPVLGLPLIISFFILISLSSLFSLFPTFDEKKIKKMAKKLVFVLVCSATLLSPEDLKAQEKAETKISPQSQKLINQLELGEDIRETKLKLAESLMQDGENNKALEIYDEIIDRQSLDNEREAYLNYLTLMLMEGRVSQAAESLYRYQGAFDDKNREKMRENIIFALNQQSKKNEQDSQESDENKKSDEGSSQDSESSSEGENSGQEGSNQQEGQQENSQQNSKDEQNSSSKDKEQTNEKESENGESEQEDGEKKQGKSEEAEKEEKQPKNWDEKVEDIKSKRKLRKELPALLQQIEGQDRELQKQQIDTRTNQRSSGRKKDW